MNKSIKYIIFGVVLGISITITYISMKTVLSMRSAIMAHEEALKSIVDFLNKSIEASKTSPVTK